MPCRSKQCRSRSVAFSGSALLVIKYANFYQKKKKKKKKKREKKKGSSNLIGWKLEVGVAILIYLAKQA